MTQLDAPCAMIPTRSLMQPDQRPTTRCEIRTRFATVDELTAQLPLAITPEGVFFVPIAELKLRKGAAVEVILRLLDRTLALRLNGEVVETLYDPLTSQSPGFWVRIPWDPKALPPALPPSAGPTIEVPAAQIPATATETAYPPTLEIPAAAGNEFDNPFQAVATNMLGLFIEFSLTEQSGESPSLDEIPVMDNEGRLASFGFLPAVNLPPPVDVTASPPEEPEPATAPDFVLPIDVATDAGADEPVLEAIAEVVDDDMDTQPAPAPRRRGRFLVALAVGAGLGGVGAFLLLSGGTGESTATHPAVVASAVPSVQRMDAAVARAAPVAAAMTAVTPDAARPVVAAVTPDAARPVMAVEPGTTAVPPAPQTVSSARTCELSVRSSPVGAEVWLGESKQGETPLEKLAVPCGGGTLTLKRPRYADLALDYQGSPEKRLRLDGKMARPLAELRVTSDPAGAAVLYRGKERGRTPLTLTVPQFEGLSFELRLPGRQPAVRQLRLAEATGGLSVSLVP